MTPFKIKISVDKYESMGYNLKAGDVIYHVDRLGHYTKYAELISYDEKQNVWIGKTASATAPITKVNGLIDITVIPFDQYLKKLNDKGFILKK